MLGDQIIKRKQEGLQCFQIINLIENQEILLIELSEFTRRMNFLSFQQNKNCSPYFIDEGLKEQIQIYNFGKNESLSPKQKKSSKTTGLELFWNYNSYMNDVNIIVKNMKVYIIEINKQNDNVTIIKLNVENSQGDTLDLQLQRFFQIIYL